MNYTTPKLNVEKTENFSKQKMSSKRKEIERTLFQQQEGQFNKHLQTYVDTNSEAAHYITRPEVIEIIYYLPSMVQSTEDVVPGR